MLRRIRTSTSKATAPGMISTAMAGQIAPGCGDDRRYQKWPRDAADLVECLVHAEAASQSDGSGGVRQQRGLGGAADRLPDPLTQYQDAGQRQSGAGHKRSDRQSRHADRCEGVAGEGECPVAPAAVRPRSGKYAEQQCHGLACAADQPHQDGGGAE